MSKMPYANKTTHASTIYRQSQHQSQQQSKALSFLSNCVEMRQMNKLNQHQNKSKMEQNEVNHD